MAQQILPILSQSRGGAAALEDAADLLSEVIEAVQDAGEKGHVTIKIEVAPDKTAEIMVSLQAKLSYSIPRRPYAKGLYFVNPQTRQLSREDPRQIEMELERKAKLEEAGATAINQVGRGVF